jgi:hypothetical protein
VNGQPQPPEIMGAGLQYPDGIGVYAPKKEEPDERRSR